MEADRYFEGMFQAMSRRNTGRTLLLEVQVQDTSGADACLSLWQTPGDETARVFYTTLGRRNLNFQLLRRGWFQCHNANGELTGRFPSSADALLNEGDFAACIREDTLDAGRTGRVLRELSRLSGTRYDAPRAAAPRAGATVTVESFLGRGAHWSYPAAQAEDCLPIAAVLVWLADFLAGSERRTLQSCPQAVALAAQWDARLHSPFARSAGEAAQSRPAPRAARRAAPVQNERWQSILAVLATV